MNRLLCAFVYWMVLSPNLIGATYYVDFAAGSDSNAGTSTGAAWRTIPGTRNAGDTAFKTSAWGSITTSNRIQPGDVIKLKSGTTHDSANGGKILISNSSGYYSSSATVANPITIERDTGWGSGAVTIDGTGMTTGGGGYGIVHVTVGGVKIDGKTTRGFTVQDSQNCGVSFYQQTATEPISAYYVYCYNNGIAYTSQSASDADFKVLNALTTSTGVIDHCEFDGGNHWHNGTVLGESQKGGLPMTCKYVISNTESYNHVGSEVSGGDGGIGFKAYNSQVVHDTCITHDNLKGFDLGEQSAVGATIDYTIKNSTSYSNSDGANLNVGNTYSGSTPSLKIFNNIFRDNTWEGCKIYAAPYSAVIVHNTFDNNGTDGPSNIDYCNLIVTVDGSSDPLGTVYIYNNALYKPGGGSNVINRRFYDGTANFEWYADYNSYVQRASEVFANWSYYVAPNCTFSYGSNGPGRASGNWYSWYGCDGSALSNGHFHADEHSKGTGATDTTAPPFTNRSTHDYTLTGHYAGLNISSQPWYIAAMGTDPNGNGRTSWDMGAFEYFAGGGHAPTVSISLPLTSSTYYTTDSIQFTGTASDQEDGTISANIVWSSNLDGTLGTGASITHALSAGTHTITASITDAASNTVTAQVLSVAVAPPAPPAAAARRPGRPLTRVF